MNISLFNGSIKNAKQSISISIEDFLIYVGNGKWKEQTENVRLKVKEDADNKEIQRIKSNSPYVTISGTFNKRSLAGLVNYSGFIAIDIDHREEDVDQVFETLSKDPYTYGLFRSISGRGVCVIIRGSSKEKHLSHFRWAQKYYKSLCDCAIDESCKDISRARYVSYDPKCIINYQAKIAGYTTIEKKPKKKIEIPATDNQVARLVKEIVSLGKNICESYDDWITVGLSLASMGEFARPLFHALSSVSDKYNEKQTDRKFSNLISTANGSVTISTFMQKCKEIGLEIHNQQEKTVISLAKTAKKMKSNVDAVVITAQNNGIPEKVSRELAQKVFDANITLDNSKDSIINDISSLLNINYKIERNLLSTDVEINGKPISTMDYNGIYVSCKMALGDKVTKTDVTSIIESPIIPSYHPVDRWLKKAKNMPSKPQVIQEFLNTLPLKHKEAKELLMHWIIGIPAFHNKEVVRLVLVLCGQQNTGKTEFFRNMLPKELRPYYAENSLTDESETPLIMSSSLIVMDDEFSGKSRRDAKKFKEINSKKEFAFRPKYGKTIEKRRRVALMAGTSNETEILSDRTGNTRILPLEYNTPYDYQKYNEMDKDQLLIEVFRAYENGKSWKLSQQSKELLDTLSVSHDTEDIELGLVDLFTQQDPKAEPLPFVEIKLHIQNWSNKTNMSDRKLGVALGKRYSKKLVKKNGNACKCYLNVRLVDGIASRTVTFL